MLKKKRSSSIASTRATSYTTSSALSYSSSQSSSRVGNTSVSVSDNSVFSLEEPAIHNRKSIDTTAIVSYDDVDIIDELYEFFGENMDCQIDFGETQFQNRERVLRRLLESEEQYIAKLQLALAHYYKPLTTHRTPSTSNSSSISRSFLLTNHSTKHTIKNSEFSVTEGILKQLEELTTTFHNELKERFTIWGPTQLASDILHRHISNLSSYTAYLEHFPVAMAAAERLMRNPATRKLLETNPEIANLKLPALHVLLIEPIVALSRYSQVLAELLPYTDPFHPDAHLLNECITRIAQIETSIAPLVHNCQEVMRAMEVSCTVRNCPILLDAPRRVIMRGVLTNVSPGSYGLRDDRRMYILMTDIILIARPRDDSEASPLVFKGQIELVGSNIREIPKKRFGHPYCFEIVTDTTDPTYKYADDVNALLAASGAPVAQTYYLRANSKESYTMWVQEISNAIQKLRQARQ